MYVQKSEDNFRELALSFYIVDPRESYFLKLYMYGCFAGIYVCALCVYCAHGGQKRVSGTL